ncbi:SusC/RagA family TonB-linked outer membrane protein [Hymenobacter koreensis]
MKHTYLPKLWFLLFLFICCSLSAAAQTGSISGRLLDDKNQPLPGVTVLVEGTQLGTSTNSEGSFLIQNVPAGAQTVVASFVGYTSKRLPVTVTAGQTVTIANTVLAENTTLLSEAVVVGYGVQRRQDVTGSISTVQSKDFVQGQVTNPEQLVQGKIAGVNVTTGGGAPGAGTTVRIRGNSSLNASNDPLFVIDGVPVDKGGISGASNPLTLINPNDIESVTVLKDASATAIYGSRASAGVILITTKRGVQGENLTVNLNSQTSVSRRANKYEVLGADEFRERIRANGNAGQIATLGAANTDWQGEIFRSAATFDNNVSLNGNVKNVPFRISYGNLNQQGIVITNKLQRHTGSISLTPVLLDGNLRIDVNAKGSRVDNRFIDNGQIGAAVLFDPTQPVRSPEAQFNPFGGYFQFLQANGNPRGLAPGNPVAALNNTNNVSVVDRFIGNVQLDYKLPFVPGLRANINLATDLSRGEGSTTINPQDFGNFNADPVTNPNRDPNLSGRYTQFQQDKDMRLLETYVAYAKDFSGTKFDILAGYSYQDFQDQGPNFLPLRFDRTTQVNPTERLTVPGFYSQLTLLSYFARTTLNVKDRYLLTATLRNDNTSRFAEETRSGYFPAVGLGWRLKGENFLANNATISELKLRAGWGQTGQQDVGGLYDFLPRYVIGNSAAQYQFGQNFITTARPSGYNRELQWETTTTLNAGLDWGILDNRISGTLDVYDRRTTDLLANVNVPAGANLTNQLNANIGSLRNRGIELGINAAPIQSEAFNWDVNFNVAYNTNEITDLGPQDANFQGFNVGGIPGGTGSNIQIQSVGFPINSFFVLQQVYNADGRPVEGLYVDRDGNGIINERDYYRYKQPNALTNLGFTSNMAYRDFSLSFVLRASLGNYVFNATAANLANYANATGSTGFLTNLPTDVRNTGFRTQQIFSDYYMENGSFLRGENITLGYNVGKVFREGSNLRLTAAVQNAFLVTKYSGLDPEIFGGIDNNFYPRARTFTFGINASF